MKTQEKIKKLETEVATLWKIIDDERLWDPSIIREIQSRSRQAIKQTPRKHLKTAEEVFTAL